MEHNSSFRIRVVKWAERNGSLLVVLAYIFLYLIGKATHYSVPSGWHSASRMTFDLFRRELWPLQPTLPDLLLAGALCYLLLRFIKKLNASTFYSLLSIREHVGDSSGGITQKWNWVAICFWSGLFLFVCSPWFLDLLIKRSDEQIGLKIGSSGLEISLKKGSREWETGHIISVPAYWINTEPTGIVLKEGDILTLNASGLVQTSWESDLDTFFMDNNEAQEKLLKVHFATIHEGVLSESICCDERIYAPGLQKRNALNSESKRSLIPYYQTLKHALNYEWRDPEGFFVYSDRPAGNQADKNGDLLAGANVRDCKIESKIHDRYKLKSNVRFGTLIGFCSEIGGRVEPVEMQIWDKMKKEETVNDLKEILGREKAYDAEGLLFVVGEKAEIKFENGEIRVYRHKEPTYVRKAWPHPEAHLYLAVNDIVVRKKALEDLEKATCTEMKRASLTFALQNKMIFNKEKEDDSGNNKIIRPNLLQQQIWYVDNLGHFMVVAKKTRIQK
jgi:hypothetical protein